MQTGIMRQGLAPTVADWVRHVAFVARCTAHDRVRCEQLVELARQWDAAGGGRLSAFVKRARSQPKENPIAARVRVMTIHAAKGLEFETVILADLQSRSGRRPDPSFAITLRGPGEPPGLELLPAAKYAEALGLQEACDRAREEDFEEDLSVLYVALTRAKSYLDVVLTAASDLKPTLAGILGEAWGHTEAGCYLIESNPPTGPSRSRASVPVMTADVGIWQPALGFGPGVFAHVPPRLAAATPSGREGAGIVNLAQLLGMGGSQALERGTAVHALLSRVEWRESLLPPGEWSDSIPAREADSAACRLAAQELHPRLLVASDPLSLVFDSSKWLDLWRGYDVKHLEVWRERRFAVVLGTELMNGSFDRVVLGLDAIGRVCRATILDFKTDRVTEGPEREERARYYQPQLDAYALALGKLTGLPADAITTQLVWIN
jgi:ATP-dependent exoDNAse (exonuclease V) beta subunit